MMSVAKLIEIDRQAAELPIDEQRELLARIRIRVEDRTPTAGLPVSLRGIWAAQIPANFDVEEALRDARGGWQHKLGDAHP